MYLETKQINNIKDIIKSVFPDFNGKNVRVEVTDQPIRVISYWDGGNRDYFAAACLKTRDVRHVPENGSMFVPAIDPIIVKPETVLIKRSVRGNRDSLTIYVNPANAGTLKIATIEPLKWEYQVVLVSTKSLKNTYAGRTNIRAEEALRQCGMSLDEFKAVQEELINLGALNKAGSITAKGRNMLEPLGFMQLHMVGKRPLIDGIVED